MSERRTLLYEFTTDRLNDRLPALGGLRGEAGDGRKLFIARDFSILCPSRMLVNTLFGVPFNMLRLRLTTNGLHAGSGETCNPPTDGASAR
jgi:hypothetical protein